MTPLDTIVFRTPAVRVGAFRCPIGHQLFGDTGPIETHIVVFPRTAVWIRHAGARAFPADPGVVTMYNKGQLYTRAPLSPEGDRSDWFGVAPDIARAIAEQVDPVAADSPEQPYRVPWSVSDADLYLRQRTLFRRMERGQVEALEGEEAVIGLVADVMRRAYGSRPLPIGARPPNEAHLDLGQRARAELARDPTASTDLSTLARSLGASPFHLCRVFRATHGTTLHEYRLDLRLRLALERLDDPSTDLSRLAFELGFSSHSHFTLTFRSRLGHPPSRLRQALSKSA
jgi:AraC-like DNA-binding protein